VALATQGKDTEMTSRKSARDSNARSTWYVAPLVWLAIAVLSLVVAPNWNDLLADPAQGPPAAVPAQEPVPER
jgi:hypothetical protein